ncbi:MAG TPA: L,D-transpeptidase family protein [Chitinophagaceae bacterium]|nr:L,D-transpeptidase family protein [Chitinophagaceae bacterium]
MKNIFTLALISLIFFAACQSKDKKTKETEESKNLKDKKISKRDFSVTKSNSFNDLFFDSSDLENYISKNSIPDSTARRIRSFYNTRNYQFAWFSSNGLTEQALGFWTLKNYSGDTATKSKQLQKRMDDLMTKDSLKVSNADKSMISTELQLTENLIDYTRNNYEKGFVKRKEMERFIPFKKADPIYLADSLLNKKHKDEKYFSDINESYKLLKDQLEKYLVIAKNDGWPSIAQDVKIFKTGKASPAILDMKKMLFLIGDLPQRDTTNVFNDSLKTGIKNFQKRYGYTQDGLVTSSLLKEMNVPAIDRVKQILINMNRMRWMPQEPPGKLILVNIPEFILHMYDGKSKVFDMVIVVGKDGHNTTIFSDKLTTIVFSPYWNLPESIVKKEILPSMAKNAGYLESHNMEITGGTQALPEIRQKPGGDNSLGKVKFLFPNSFNIYFHDTPAKSLFSKDVRAYSHGCIRLSDPEKLANYLLKDNSKWTPEKINEAMNSGDEQFVAVKNPVPVFITYYTAWVDDTGLLNFRTDIYGHDKEIAQKMFETSTSASTKVVVLNK